MYFLMFLVRNAFLNNWIVGLLCSTVSYLFGAFWTATYWSIILTFKRVSHLWTYFHKVCYSSSFWHLKTKLIFSITRWTNNNYATNRVVVDSGPVSGGGGLIWQRSVGTDNVVVAAPPLSHLKTPLSLTASPSLWTLLSTLKIPLSA